MSPASSYILTHILHYLLLMSNHPTITDSARIKCKIDRYNEQTNRAIEKLRVQEADINARKIAVEKAKGTDNSDPSWMQQQTQAIDALQQQFMKDQAKINAAQMKKEQAAGLYRRNRLQCSIAGAWKGS